MARRGRGKPKKSNAESVDAVHVALVRRVMVESVLLAMRRRLSLPENYYETKWFPEDAARDDAQHLKVIEEEMRLLRVFQNSHEALLAGGKLAEFEDAALVLGKFRSYRMKKHDGSDEINAAIRALSDISERKILTRRTMKKVADAYSQVRQRARPKPVAYETPVVGMNRMSSDVGNNDANIGSSGSNNSSSGSGGTTQASSSGSGQSLESSSNSARGNMEPPPPPPPAPADQNADDKTEPPEQQKKKRKKKKRRPKKDAQQKSMTSRERSEARLFDLRDMKHRFEDYLPLNSLWKQYIVDLLASSGSG